MKNKHIIDDWKPFTNKPPPDSPYAKRMANAQEERMKKYERAVLRLEELGYTWDGEDWMK